MEYTDFDGEFDSTEFDNFFGTAQQRQERLEKRLGRRSDRQTKRDARQQARQDAKDLRNATRQGMSIAEYIASKSDSCEEQWEDHAKSSRYSSSASMQMAKAKFMKKCGVKSDDSAQNKYDKMNLSNLTLVNPKKMKKPVSTTADNQVDEEITYVEDKVTPKPNNMKYILIAGAVVGGFLLYKKFKKR